MIVPTINVSVGRTARAGRSGQCFTFVRHEEVKPFKLMLKKVENSKQKEIQLDYEFINNLMPRYEVHQNHDIFLFTHTNFDFSKTK